MQLHVVIATHGRAALLRRTLESLAACDAAPELAGVHVAENGSKDDAEATAREFAGRLPVRYHHFSRAGQARARQAVVEQIGTGLVLFTDDDVRFRPDVLVQYARAGREHGPDAILGGPIRVDYEDGSGPPAWLRAYLPPSAVGWDRDHPWPGFLGANYAVYAERILAVGGFDAALGPGALKPGAAGNPSGHEDDLQRRLVAAGARKVYLPEAEVWHWVPAERCNPRWALHRRYRGAFTEGLRGTALEDPNGVRWFGVPRWYWRVVLRDAARLGRLPVVRDAGARFAMLHTLWGHAGRIRGERMRRQQPAAGVASVSAN